MLIYQVLGDLRKYKPVTYKINEHVSSRTPLTSVAIAELCRKHGMCPKIIFIWPISIMPESVSIEHYEPLSYIDSEFHYKDFKRDAAYSLSSRINGVEFDVLPVGWLGKLSVGKDEIVYKCLPSSISAQILLDMLKRIEDDKNGIIVDISTGHNFYAPLIFEALRAVVVCSKMRAFSKREYNKDKSKLQSRSKIPWNDFSSAINKELERYSHVRDNSRGIIAKFAISGPVDSSTGECSLFLNEYDVKAFFDLPININKNEKMGDPLYYLELEANVKKRIGPEIKDLSKKLHYVLKNTLMGFNAIKFNTPLVIYSGLIDLSENGSELFIDLIKFYEQIIQPTIINNSITMPKVKIKELVNLFISVSMYRWLSESLQTSKEGATLNELENFMNLQESIGQELNKIFLRREIDEIQRLSRNKQFERICLKDLRNEGKNSAFENLEERRKGNIKRNFFAHCGFEENFVEVIRDKEKLLLRYKPECIETIKRFVSEPA